MTMLRIFCGRESVNKDKFIYENVKGKTLLLVPDQFTLQAERDALFYMGKKGLMGIEVLSMNRLGSRVLKECGGGRRAMIDKRGRHMLLSKILKKEDPELGVFGGYSSNNDFIEMTNDFISELKQYSTGPEDLSAVIDDTPKNSFLHRKLADVQKIFADYEEQIAGKYIDTEDYVTLYASKIGQSEAVLGSTVWIYGFDYFTPKNLEVIGKLMTAADDVNIVLTWSAGHGDDDIFSIGTNMTEKLRELAQDEGVKCEGPTDIAELGSGTSAEKAKYLSFVEKNLFAVPAEKIVMKAGGERTEEADEIDGQVTLLRATDYYSEAEAAVIAVRDLVRTRGCRYSDIAIICNDLETRGRLTKRVFAQYGIDLFMDEKRDIMSSPVVSYMISLLDMITKGYRREDVMKLMKSGLTDVAAEDVDELENYAAKYFIRGPKWRRDFVKGQDETDLAKLNEMRKSVIGPIEKFDRDYTDGKTVSEKVKVMYEYLSDVAKLPERIEGLIAEQTETGELEAAGETAQVWNVTVDIFDQLIDMIGDERISKRDFADLFRAGMESAEIGVLPPAADGLLMGTMQRTRTGMKKAVIVIGANEGVLPAAASGEGILNEDEKLELAARGIEICKLDRLRIQEENLAIYKNISKASEYLYMSCSSSDDEGKQTRPSTVFEKIKELFTGIDIKTGEEYDLVQAPGSTIGHLADEVRKCAESGEELPDEWKEALLWYRKNDPEILERMESALTYHNTVSRIDHEQAEALYKKEGADILSLSPSRLEKYGKCPFMHFVSYGLMPDEPRVYEVGGAEIGDVCHICLMELASSLTKKDVKITDDDSPWMSATEEGVCAKVDAVLEEKSRTYKEGILSDSKAEEYRTRRMRDVIRETAWNMVKQVQRGSTDSMAFESEFRRGKDLKPVSIPGTDVLIEGKIDRLDIMPGDYAKVIDYKSGSSVKYRKAEVMSGLQLQLMLYMRAAKESGHIPAGAFYFHVDRPSLNADKITDITGENGQPSETLKKKLAAEERKTYLMDGVMMNTAPVANAIDNNDGKSDVVPATKKEGIFSDSRETGKYLSEEEFTEYTGQVEKMVDAMCAGLESGNIEIHPKMTSNKTSSCTYCDYRGICKFDRSVPGYRMDYVREKKEEE